MNTRYRLVHRGIRGGMYYCFDKITSKRASLNTTNEDAARQIIEAKNQAVRQPAINLQIAQAYLQHGDPVMAKRTWQDVMDAMAPLKTGPTQRRWVAAMRDKPSTSSATANSWKRRPSFFCRFSIREPSRRICFCAACIITRPECTGYRGRCCPG